MSDKTENPLCEIRDQLFAMEAAAQKVSPEQADSKCIDCAELSNLRELERAQQEEIGELRERLKDIDIAYGAYTRDAQNALRYESNRVKIEKAEVKRLRDGIRELGHDWCRDHCDGDQHTDECDKALALLDAGPEQSKEGDS